MHEMDHISGVVVWVSSNTDRESYIKTGRLEGSVWWILGCCGRSWVSPSYLILYIKLGSIDHL